MPVKKKPRTKRKRKSSKKIPIRQPIEVEYDPAKQLSRAFAKYKVPARVLNRFVFPYWEYCSVKDLCTFAHNLGDPHDYDWLKSWAEQDGWLNMFYGAVAQSLARIEKILNDSGADAGYGPPVFYDPGPGEGIGPPPPPKFPPE